MTTEAQVTANRINAHKSTGAEQSQSQEVGWGLPQQKSCVAEGGGARPLLFYTSLTCCCLREYMAFLWLKWGSLMVCYDFRVQTARNSRTSASPFSEPKSGIRFYHPDMCRTTRGRPHPTRLRRCREGPGVRNKANRGSRGRFSYARHAFRRDAISCVSKRKAGQRHHE
jgi:hypothetical protein